MTHIIIRDVALVTDLWCFGSSFGSGAPRMSVAGPSRRLPSCRRRKRLRPGVGWWGSPVRFIVDLGLVCFPLVVVLWCVGNPDLWDRGLVCFGEPFFLPQLTHCLGTGSCPNHRLSAVGLSYALETINYKFNDVDPTFAQERRGW